MSYSSHEKPAYYNLITVIAGYVPYTLLVIISLFAIKYKSFDFGINQWWKNFAIELKQWIQHIYFHY